MPTVANYFVRPEGVTLSLATVKDVQYGESIDNLNRQRVPLIACYGHRVATVHPFATFDYYSA